MSKRHPQLNGNHGRRHRTGDGAIHPHLRGGGSAYGGHPGQARFAAEGNPAEGGAPPAPPQASPMDGPETAPPATGPMMPD